MRVADQGEVDGPVPTKGGVRSWAILLLLMFAMIFALVDRSAIALLTEPMEADLKLSDGQLGSLNGLAFGLFYGVMGLPMGVLADRWSRKGTILLGIGAWSVATAACGLARSFSQLLMARIWVGAGEAGLVPASYSLIHDLFPKNQLARAMSIFSMGGTLGSGCALFVVGLTYGHFQAAGSLVLPGLPALLPWQATFLAIALPGPLFLIPIVLIRFPRAPRRKALATTGENLREKPSSSAFYALLFIAMSGILMVSLTLLAWVPAVAQREFGMSAAAVGTLYGAIVLITPPIALAVGGILADALQARRITSAHVGLICAVAIALLPLTLFLSVAHGRTIFFVDVALIHLIGTLPVGVAPALIQLRTPASSRASISALYVLIANLASFALGPFLVGVLSDRMGSLHASLTTVCTLAIICAITASIPLLRGDRRRAWGGS